MFSDSGSGGQGLGLVSGAGRVKSSSIFLLFLLCFALIGQSRQIEASYWSREFKEKFLFHLLLPPILSFFCVSCLQNMALFLLVIPGAIAAVHGAFKKTCDLAFWNLFKYFVQKTPSGSSSCWSQHCIEDPFCQSLNASCGEGLLCWGACVMNNIWHLTQQWWKGDDAPSWYKCEAYICKLWMDLFVKENIHSRCNMNSNCLNSFLCGPIVTVENTQCWKFVSMFPLVTWWRWWGLWWIDDDEIDKNVE